MTAAPLNSYAENNLFFIPADGHATVVDKGTGNTLRSNTTIPNNTPKFVNSSGSFSRISDFEPTANFSGGGRVPVWQDALAKRRSETWNLGAISH